MAETSKPAAEWTPDTLRTAVKAGSIDQKVELLKELGLLSENGKPAAKAASWGTKATRTPDEE